MDVLERQIRFFGHFSLCIKICKLDKVLAASSKHRGGNGQTFPAQRPGRRWRFSFLKLQELHQEPGMRTAEVVKAVYRIGTHRALRALQGSAVTVLMYHGVVADDCTVTEDDWLQVKESDFREQMGFLSEHYEVITLEQAWESKPGASPKPRAVITFDDGYANNYHVAYPILREFGLPATIFLVTGAIGSRSLFWYDRLQTALKGLLPARKVRNIREGLKARVHPHALDAAVDALLRDKIGSVEPTDEAIAAYRPLNFLEIEEMGRSGAIRFGSHTHRHEILTKMTRVEVEETLARSLDVLRGLPGASNYFCYPNGCHGPEHDEILRRFGFAGALRVGGGLWTAGTDPFHIPRIGIGRDMNLAKFAGAISGLLPKLRKILGLPTRSSPC